MPSISDSILWPHDDSGFIAFRKGDSGIHGNECNGECNSLCLNERMNEWMNKRWFWQLKLLLIFQLKSISNKKVVHNKREKWEEKKGKQTMIIEQNY